MIRRGFTLAALFAVLASFAVTLFLWRRTIRDLCGDSRGVLDEGAGNCLTIHMSNIWLAAILFGFSGFVLAVLILLPNSDSDK
jgi:hypothetical protein